MSNFKGKAKWLIVLQNAALQRAARLLAAALLGAVIEALPAEGPVAALLAVVHKLFV